MGQAAQSVALLLMEHVRSPFTGPVLGYGIQAMNIGFEGTLRMFAAVGLEPDPAGMTDPPPPTEYIGFDRLVRLMGLGELATLDVSDYEGAEIVADLNLPVPSELTGRFGWIIDGGTMEHVFDVRQGMQNTADMLRPGGRAIHISPANNYVNHGFTQLSPAFYHEYYAANGFDDVHGILIVQPRANMVTTDWNFVQYDHPTMGGLDAMLCSQTTQIAIYFSARKNAASTSDRVPAQAQRTRRREGRGGLPYQLVISHGAGQPAVQPLRPPPPTAGAAVHALVHVGFGSP